MKQYWETQEALASRLKESECSCLLALLVVRLKAPKGIPVVDVDVDEASSRDPKEKALTSAMDPVHSFSRYAHTKQATLVSLRAAPVFELLQAF